MKGWTKERFDATFVITGASSRKGSGVSAEFVRTRTGL
jgi:hypothetical protein